MKKLFLFPSVFLLFIPLTVSTQTYLGFKTGYLAVPYLKYADYHKYQNASIDYQPSFAISAVLKDQFSRHFSVGFNLNYSYYVADYSYSWYNATGGGGKKEAYCKLGYLGIYFYPQLNFGNRLNFYFNAGIFYGWLLNNSIENTDEETVDYNDLEPSYGISFMTEAGFSYDINSKWQIILDASFRRTGQLFDNSTIEGQWDLMFNLGFFYKIGEKSLLNNKKTAPDF